jgi:hypothetical protein
MESNTDHRTVDPVSGEAATGNINRNLYWAGAGFSFLFSLVLYVKTMAASASFWDAGEFIAAAHTLAVPHSPGTPLYVLVAKVFTLLPLPFFSIAERVNLLSAFCGAAGVLFVYMLVVRFMDVLLGRTQTQADAVVKVAGALVGALFIACSDTYWNNAIEAEVYAMSTALMGFMTWLALKWGDKPRDDRSTFLIYLLFYLLAMSVGFHLGTVLAISGIFFYVWMEKNKAFSNLEFVVACVGVAIFMADATLYRDGRVTVFLLVIYAATLIWLYGTNRRFAVITAGLFLIGLSIHLYLMIRSTHNPMIDMGNPETWRELYAVLRREQYPPMNVASRKAGFVFQLTHFNGYFQTQFQMASAYISKLNAGSLIPIALGIWGMVDQYAKNRRAFILLFVTLVVVSLGLIVFLNFSSSEVRERDYFYSPAFYYFAIYIGIGAAALLNELRLVMDRRGSTSPALVYVFAVVLLALPFFTLNNHYFSHDRSNNYTCPAYARNMLISLEPNAIIFTNGDNDTYPLWYIQEVEGFRKDIRVVNLSLLNTPWYIKQCRDNEPKVPITWTDQRIDGLTPVPSGDRWLMVKDIAVQHILQANNWEKPIYFGVTVPRDTYAPYLEILELQGLAYKVVRRRGENMMDKELLAKNVLENYDYTSILDENWKRDHSVFLPRHTRYLIQHYAWSFMRLAFIQHRDGLYRDALLSMETAHEIAPQLPEPIQLLGWYYLDAGDTTRAVEFYRDKIAGAPTDANLRFRLAGVYERVGEDLKALEQLEYILRLDPNHQEATMAAVGMLLRAGQPARARQVLADWVRRHPDDTQARESLAELDRQAQQPPESQ